MAKIEVEIEIKAELSNVIHDLSRKIKSDLQRFGRLTDTTLGLFSLFQVDASMIKQIETELQLVPTGDLDQMIHNFSGKYYTPTSARLYLEGPPSSRTREKIRRFLMKAAKYGHSEVITGGFKYAPNSIEILLKAIDYQHLELMKFMIHEIVNQLSENRSLQWMPEYDLFGTGFHHAIKNGNEEIVDLFIEVGSYDHRFPTNDFRLAFETAVQSNHLHLVKKFVARMEDDGMYSSGLMISTGRGCEEIVSYLISIGNFSLATLNNALSQARSIGIAKILMAVGANDFNTALELATEDEISYEYLEFLVDAGATNLNDVIDNVMMYEDPAMIKLLVEKGANVNACLEILADRDFSDTEDQIQLIEWLINRGATYLNLALTTIIYNDSLELTKFLVERGATNIEEVLISAIETSSDPNIIQYLTDQLPKVSKSMIRSLVKLDKMDIMIRLLAKDPSMYVIALEAAGRYRNRKMIQAIVKFLRTLEQLEDD